MTMGPPLLIAVITQHRLQTDIRKSRHGIDGHDLRHSEDGLPHHLLRVNMGELGQHSLITEYCTEGNTFVGLPSCSCWAEFAFT